MWLIIEISISAQEFISLTQSIDSNGNSMMKMKRKLNEKEGRGDRKQCKYQKKRRKTIRHELGSIAFSE